MLVRRGLVFNTASRLWGTAHRDWLRSLVFDNDVDRAVVTEYTLAVEQPANSNVIRRRSALASLVYFGPRFVQTSRSRISRETSSRRLTGSLHSN
jgi:hypothetical protein